MTNKLELTWVGKEKEINIEPRILIEDKGKSYSRPKFDTILNSDGVDNQDNMLIHGDNLLALKALEPSYAEKIKCIYIDPPYNTGAAKENYDDNLEHSIWLSLMKPRLEILRTLLREDGIIFIQIDDNEQAYLKVLCDEIFGRNNYLNTIVVKMKNIAGASGGGEDKRLKKNVEFLLAYTKNYQKFSWLQNAYSLTEIYSLIQSYKAQEISWKYTSVLYNSGNEKYLTSTVDGDGNEIKIFNRENYEILSISEVAKKEGISEKEVYYRYIDRIFTTAMPQSSIRPRVMEKLQGKDHSDLISIKYVPKTGKNKGILYEQFYKGNKFRLFTWLKDVIEKKDGILYKKDLQGTYWDGFNLNNLTKEGGVEFPKGKKPEALLKRIIDMSTKPNDYVLDSFLGSGTTIAVAHKLRRHWIGIEMKEQAYTHCKKRIDLIIAGKDQGGISKEVDWHGGGGYKFYELAPSLITTDSFGEPVIDKRYNANMLASAVALHEGFKYEPDQSCFWKQSKGTENSYLYVTTSFITPQLLDKIENDLGENQYLVIACAAYKPECENLYKNITIKKIPEMLLGKCEFGKDNYNLNIIDPPKYDDEDNEGGNYNE